MIVSAADVSQDLVYRYSLTREWAQLTRILFVMLNPSTADASEDDPTIRKCVGYAKRWGYGSLEVVNLYAFRSTDPRALWRLGSSLEDDTRRGPRNSEAIAAASNRAQLVVAAWGAHSRDQAEEGLVISILKKRHFEVWCLGFTKAGKPRHPLMTAYATALVPFFGGGQA